MFLFIQVIIGGDGSLTGANLFKQEWTGLLEELVAKGNCELVFVLKTEIYKTGLKLVFPS